MSKHGDRARLPLPALVIDASSPCVAAGVLGADRTWQAYAEYAGGALESLFSCVEQALQAAQTELSELRSFIYSEGPGSVLGLRLAAMAIQTWSRLQPEPLPRYAYNSLCLTAELILRDQPQLSNGLLVSDWKKDAWHAIQFADGKAGPLKVIDTATLNAWSGPRFHLPQRKGWQTPPENCTTVAHQPKCLIDCLDETGLLWQTEGIQLYSASSSRFQKWVPQRHRGP